jgi:Ca2+ transporting ATPase
MIVVFIFILQILLVSFGSLAFGIYAYYGLTVQQWLLSVINLLIFRLQFQ